MTPNEVNIMLQLLGRLVAAQEKLAQIAEETQWEDRAKEAADRGYLS